MQYVSIPRRDGAPLIEGMSGLYEILNYITRFNSPKGWSAPHRTIWTAFQTAAPTFESPFQFPEGMERPS